MGIGGEMAWIHKNAYIYRSMKQFFIDQGVLIVAFNKVFTPKGYNGPNPMILYTTTQVINTLI